MRIAATLTTTPSCGAAGSTNWVGTTTSRPTPGSQGSTPGIREQHFLVAHVEAAGNIGQRIVLADGGLLHVAHDVAAFRRQLEAVRWRSASAAPVRAEAPVAAAAAAGAPA